MLLRLVVFSLHPLVQIIVLQVPDGRPPVEVEGCLVLRQEAPQHLGEPPGHRVVVVCEVGEAPPTQLGRVVHLAGLDQPQSLPQQVPAPPTDLRHLLYDGLLHQADQPRQDESVGQLDDSEAVCVLHWRGLVSVEEVEEMFECRTEMSLRERLRTKLL